MTLSLPPFTPAVIWLLGLNTAVFLLMELFGLVLPGIDRSIFDYFSLIPSDVTHGWIWQIVTYSFLHAGFWLWFGAGGCVGFAAFCGVVFFRSNRCSNHHDRRVVRPCPRRPE